MLGHIAIISMVFATWAVFRSVENTYGPRGGTVDWLRAPDYSSRCDELTEQQRLAKIQEWNNRNVWNEPKHSKKDKMQGKGWEIVEPERTFEENIEIFKTVRKLFDLENPTSSPSFESFRTTAKREDI